MEEELKLAKSLLEVAKCPNCSGDGVIIVETIKTGTKWVDDGHGNPIAEPVPEVDYDQEPCEWCHRKDSLLNP